MDDICGEDEEKLNQAKDIALVGFIGLNSWVRGGYVSQSRKNIRYRTLAATWVTDPAQFRNFRQKEFAQRHGLNPQAFCRAVNNFSKQFGIINERMKPRADRSTYTYGGRVLPAKPRKRVL